MMYVISSLLIFVVFTTTTVITTYALDNGLALTPPMGWLSWERYACEIDCVNFPNDCINEQLYMRTADLLVSQGYKDAGYEYVNIDDCWPALQRGPNGELLADPQRFPHGIAALADYVHAKGLKLGIYLDIGTQTCGGYPGFNVTTDKSNDQYIKDINLLASWGIDSLKVDGCNADVASMNLTYPKLGAALNETGRPILYSCSWPDYVRYEGYPIQFDLLVEYCNLWRIYNDIDDSYGSISDIINYFAKNNAALSPVPRPGAWNDPDMLMIGGTGLSHEQEKMQMAVWSILAAPLLMSNDLSSISEESKQILQNPEVIAVNQDPKGVAGRLIASTDSTQIWARTLANGDQAVAFVRFDSFGPPIAMSVSASQLGWTTPLVVDNDNNNNNNNNYDLHQQTFVANNTVVMHIRDLFLRQDIGNVNDEINIHITSSSVLFYRVSLLSLL